MIFKLTTFLAAFILFFVLSPGVLLRLPPKGDKFTVAVVHAIVFSVLFSVILYFLRRVKEGVDEGFELEHEGFELEHEQ